MSSQNDQATEEGSPNLSETYDNGHYFNFKPFYRQPQFCDRFIRMEILREEQPGEAVGRESESVTSKKRRRDEDGSGNGSARSAKAPLKRLASKADRKSAPATGVYKYNTCMVTLMQRWKENWKCPSCHWTQKPVTPPKLREPSTLSDDEERSSSEDKEERTDGVVPQSKSGPAIGGGESESSERRLCENLETVGAGIASGEEPPPETPLTRVEEIPISSIVVAAKCGGLRAMLESETGEGGKGAPMVVKVTPQEKEAFKEMIDFIYNGVLSEPLLAADFVPELVAADKFDAPSFLDAILGELMERTTAGETADLERIAFDVPEALRWRTGVDQLVDQAQASLLESFKNVDDWECSSQFLELGEKAVLFLLECDLEGRGEESVVEGVLGWIRSRFQTDLERVGALERLAPKIRFGCCSGEFLERLMERPETQSPKIQNLLRKALIFQAYSETKKLESVSSFSRERAGVKKNSVDVFLNFTIDGSSESIESARWSWLGRTWMVVVSREEGPKLLQSTVGLYLTRCAVVGDKGQENRGDTVEFKVYVRVLSGYWVLLNKTSPYRFSKDMAEGTGNPEMLKCSWEEIQGSQYASCTGEVNFRVVARRLC